MSQSSRHVRLRVLLRVLGCSGALLALPAHALAQARPEAEQLFRDGKQLMKEGKTLEACQAFEASERAEPNLATLLSLADCHEKAHQYASAWARFLAAESRARGDAKKGALMNTARQRAQSLEARLSYLTINVPDESRVDGLVVTRDGLEVDAAQWNRAVPVDGGPHIISGKAPGHEPWQTTVQVGLERDQRAVEVPRFKELPALALPPPAAVGRRDETAAALESSDDDDAEDTTPSSRFTTRRKVALGVAAGGVVAAGTAIGFGLAARSARNDALATCPGAQCPMANAADAQRKNDRARRDALIANVGFAVAGAATIGAAVLWFTSPPERPTRSVTLMPVLGSANGLAVAGGF